MKPPADPLERHIEHDTAIVFGDFDASGSALRTAQVPRDGSGFVASRLVVGQVLEGFDIVWKVESISRHSTPPTESNLPRIGWQFFPLDRIGEKFAN
jgi:hypothetical protein